MASSVAIPLNRVIVATEEKKDFAIIEFGRNPLKSGHRCNLNSPLKKQLNRSLRRNPLKSGHRCNLKKKKILL